MLEFGYRNAILLVWDVDATTERQWELGPFSSSDGLRVMAGWTVVSEEGGVPPAVARTFARAMTRYGRVTFPCSTIDVHSEDKQDVEALWRQVQAKGDDHAWFAREGGTGGGSSRSWHRLFSSGGGLGRGKAAVVSLLSTLQEETVAELLFEDPYYQWWNASQVALVSRATKSLPATPWRFIGELFEEGWGRVAAAAEAEGAVEAVMRSGVDGDVCGLVFANGKVRRAFERLLEAAAAELGLVVRTVSYTDFGQLLSDALGGRPGD
jgi:hypothetical protein